MKKTFFSAVIATFAGTMTFAQSATDQIINDLTGQGFERIEIDNGLGQIKVEAIRGTQKLEVVYDRATGSIIKQEVERVRAGEDTRPGIEIRDRDRDFVETRSTSDDSRVTSTNGTTSTARVNTMSGSTEELVRDLQEQGFTRIEVKNGVTQTKVEAVRGTEKVETVFDRASGEVIKQEIESIDSDEDTRPGVEIRDRDRDFVDGDRAEDDDDDRRDGRDDDDDDRQGGRDDDDDDNRNGSDDDNGDRDRDNDRDRDHDDDSDDDDSSDDDDGDDGDDSNDDDSDDDDEEEDDD